MIAYLAGKIIDRGEKSVILNVNGVGYRVYVPLDILAESQQQHDLELLIHTVVREDAITLYGMKTKDDLLLFELLISVKGVGPKIGLDVLSASKSNIITAIASGDTASLTQVKGLGKKTAERIILELKSKVELLMADDGTSFQEVVSVDEDIVLALEGLGYGRPVIQEVLQEKPKDICEDEEVIKWFLKNA